MENNCRIRFGGYQLLFEIVQFFSNVLSCGISMQGMAVRTKM